MTMRTAGQKQRDGTINQRGGNGRDSAEGFTTVRYGKGQPSIGNYGRIPQQQHALGAGTPSREVQKRHISDPDEDIGDDKRARRLDRAMFKPGLIVRAPLHVSVVFASSY